MWRKLLDNLWLKLGAVLLALLLWLYASTDKSYEYTFSYSLELANLSPDFILAEPLPKVVKIKVYGRGKELLKFLLFEKKNLKIDAREFHTGKRMFPLKKEMVDIPEGLDLSAMEVLSPRDLKINLQKVEEKKVPIIAQLSFTPAEGYFIKGEAKLIPDRVRVRGPSESIRKVNFVLTEKKEFQNLTRSFSENIGLLSPSFFNLKIFPQQADFSVEVRKGEKSRLEKLSVKLLNLPKGRKGYLTPQTIDLELFGEKEALEKLIPESVNVFIDGRGLKNGKIKIPPSIQLPEDVILLKAEPDSINLEIK